MEPKFATATLSSLNSTSTGQEAMDRTGSDFEHPVQPQSARLVDLRLRELAYKYEIPEETVELLRPLSNFEIVLLCDDSGSMKTPVDGTGKTRWDELRSVVKIVLEIGCIFDSNGLDLFFLNRESFRNIRDLGQVDQAFIAPPAGYTPLVPVLRKILQLPVTRPNDSKKLLIFIATDGEPTDERGKPNVDELQHVMNDERYSDTTHVMFLVCTDDAASVNYLRQWDQTMKNVDVTDDFRTERELIRRKNGANHPFSLSDYIAKALVGAVNRQIDVLDDLPQANNGDGQ
ncbi:unnamed protein product [Didymodactylos carnosus]|uniref:VWFA domain-containing protein n=1 Tax=Didymodactylos carnosus TaxID=1234261 RepID=A0A815CQ45_9BILA|nr:unnamed protein product [Didymodactylos carnosus]CAF1283254.1 unnamed protein product [Didymodactylos carnosus]CAF3862134.1 unnamed protein product [Didymodactylos carnosus]CAF4080532.1 unnamed protein product [Didymodactylos carnosus]